LPLCFFLSIFLKLLEVREDREEVEETEREESFFEAMLLVSENISTFSLANSLPGRPSVSRRVFAQKYEYYPETRKKEPNPFG